MPRLPEHFELFHFVILNGLLFLLCVVDCMEAISTCKHTQYITLKAFSIANVWASVKMKRSKIVCNSPIYLFTHTNDANEGVFVLAFVVGLLCFVIWLCAVNIWSSTLWQSAAMKRKYMIVPNFTAYILWNQTFSFALACELCMCIEERNVHSIGIRLDWTKFNEKFICFQSRNQYSPCKNNANKYINKKVLQTRIHSKCEVTCKEDFISLSFEPFHMQTTPTHHNSNLIFSFIDSKNVFFLNHRLNRKETKSLSRIDFASVETFGAYQMLMCHERIATDCDGRLCCSQFGSLPDKSTDWLCIITIVFFPFSFLLSHIQRNPYNSSKQPA